MKTELSDLSTTSRLRLYLEEKLIEFDQLWSEGTTVPDVQAFLSSLSFDELEADQVSVVRVELLTELIRIDLEYRWKHEQSRFAEDYFAMYPDALSDAFRSDIFEAEFESRLLVDKLPLDEELERRFGSEAEHWKQRIQSLTTNQAEVGDSDASETLAGSSVGVRERAVRRFGGMNLNSGDRIGDYVLESELGRGAFAVVWRATDLKLERTVAIKILRPDHTDRDDGLTIRMMREAKAVAQTDHVGIVNIFEVGQTGGLTYIVQQFVDGPSLKQLVASEKPSIEDSIEIVRAVAEALHAMHRIGIVHRDIKPANIMMAGAVTPKIVDFGLAVFDQASEATLTRRGDLLGTPAYMSPQQAGGEHHLVDSRSDVYSLGAVLYFLVTGKLPFEGNTWQVIENVIHRAPVRPRKIDPAISPDLETIILKCLEKQPEHRYSSAEILATDLQRFQNGQPILARPAGVFEVAWKWARRSPKLAATIGVAVLMAAVSAGALIQLANVSAQRNRAEKAEQRGKVLFHDSTLAAGRLAMQRGLMTSATEHFYNALEEGGTIDGVARLDLLECLIATGRLEEARVQLEILDDETLENSQLGRARIIEALLALESGEPFDVAIDLFEKAQSLPLTPGARAFVEAMLANTTPDAVSKIRESLDLEPLSHSSRRMLVLLLFSIAEFDEARNQLAIADQLFPGDRDFAMLRAVVLATGSDLNPVNELISTIPLNAEGRGRWQAMCDRVHKLCNDYSHYEVEGRLAFDQLQLSLLSEQFINEVAPTFQEMGFAFPPRLGKQLSDFWMALTAFSKKEMKLPQLLPKIEGISRIHPEGSLLGLAASHYMSKNDFSKALELCKLCEGRSGFVKDTGQMISEAKFVLTSMLAKTGPKEDRVIRLKEVVEIAESFESSPKIVELYSKTKRNSVALITALVEAMKEKQCSDTLVLKWLNRGRENGVIGEIDGLWIESIVALRAHRYVDAVKLGNRLLKADPDNKSQLRDSIQGLINTANGHIKNRDKED